MTPCGILPGLCNIFTYLGAAQQQQIDSNTTKSQCCAHIHKHQYTVFFGYANKSHSEYLVRNPVHSAIHQCSRPKVKNKNYFFGLAVRIPWAFKNLFQIISKFTPYGLMDGRLSHFIVIFILLMNMQRGYCSRVVFKRLHKLF